MRARLYLDEDVVPELARMLRDDGYDVSSAHETGGRSLTDEEQLARATADGRAILTFNYRDFIALASAWSAARRPHAGIVVSYRQFARKQLGEAAQLIARLLDSATAEELRNTVRILGAGDVGIGPQS